MRRQDIERLLSRVTYKPGSRISVIEPILHSISREPDLVVRVEQPVKNVNPPYNWTSVAKTFFIKKHDLRKMGEKDLYERLYKEILDMEEHELREFFKVDGQHFIDPHPENRMMKEMERWQREALDHVSGRGRWPKFPDFKAAFDRAGSTRDQEKLFDRGGSTRNQEKLFGAEFEKEKPPVMWKTYLPASAPDPALLVKYIASVLPSPRDAEEDNDEKPETEG